MVMENRSIGFLNGVIHRGAHRYFERELYSLGLHRGMIHILKELSRNDGISQQGLCEILAVDKANVTRILGRMESSGLVKRESCCDDARVKHINLTDKGRAVLEPLDRILRRWTEILTHDMNGEEVEMLRNLLERSISGISMYFNGIEHCE